MSNRRRGPGRAGGPDRPKLTEEEQFAEFVRHIRSGTAKKIEQSSYVMSFVPTADGVDVKYAVELGLAIMMGKPLILLTTARSDVPPKLRQIADAEIDMADLDIDTEAGQEAIGKRVSEVLARLDGI